MTLQEVAGALVYAGRPRWQVDIAGCKKWQELLKRITRDDATVCSQTIDFVGLPRWLWILQGAM